MALSQLFWDVLMPWNLKSTYFSLKMIHFLSVNIWYVIYVVFWIKYWNLKLPHHCILFLFTICTVSQLFWNRVCSCPELKHKIHCYQSFYFIRKCWFPTEYKKTFWNCIWNCRVTLFLTLKTVVMMQIFQLCITGINYTLKCIQIWKLLFQIVLMFDIKRPFSVSLRICYQMNMN